VRPTQTRSRGSLQAEKRTMKCGSHYWTIPVPDGRARTVRGREPPTPPLLARVSAAALVLLRHLSLGISLLIQTRHFARLHQHSNRTQQPIIPYAPHLLTVLPTFAVYSILMVLVQPKHRKLPPSVKLTILT
jgi:hypothetical protein